MDNKTVDKWLFWSVAIYLPSSIIFIFWLYISPIIYTPGTGYYSLFYGTGGNIALLWLLAVLLPAILSLVLRTKGWKFFTRLLGAAGFYFLLGSLISTYGYLALPGFIFLLASTVINRRLKKQQSQDQ